MRDNITVNLLSDEPWSQFFNDYLETSSWTEFKDVSKNELFDDFILEPDFFKEISCIANIVIDKEDFSEEDDETLEEPEITEFYFNDLTFEINDDVDEKIKNYFEKNYDKFVSFLENDFAEFLLDSELQNNDVDYIVNTLGFNL